MNRFVCRPEDTDERVLRMVAAAVRSLTRDGKAADVSVKKYVKVTTPPQRRTVWMWHGEVAAQLSERASDLGHDVKWTRNDVHELIFKPLFLPQVALMLPDGSEVYRPKGLSDRDTTVREVTQAMEAYLAWIYQRSMDVTIPDEYEYMMRSVEV